MIVKGPPPWKVERDAHRPCPRCGTLYAGCFGRADHHHANPVQRGRLRDHNDRCVFGVRWKCAVCWWQWIVLDHPMFNGTITPYAIKMTVTREDFARSGHAPPDERADLFFSWYPMSMYR